MPLRLELKAHEKIFINGAVVENGPDRVSLSLLNDAAILREKDILTEARADTPCKRIYLCLQLMYMDPQHSEAVLAHYAQLAAEVAEAAPSTRALLARIEAERANDRLYPALREARKLIDYERELVDHAHPAP